MFRPPAPNRLSPFAFGFLWTFTLGTALLLGLAWWLLGSAASPLPRRLAGPASPGSGYHHEGYTYIRGARVKIIREGRPMEEDPVIGPEWQRLHNVILPCGHRWAYYTSGTYSSRRDVCEQGHSFVFEEGVWVPKPPDPEPGPASGAFPGR